MAGLTVFHDLASALRAGYQQYDKIPVGYLVRIKTANGWAMAIVDLLSK